MGVDFNMDFRRNVDICRGLTTTYLGLYPHIYPMKQRRGFGAYMGLGDFIAHEAKDRVKPVSLIYPESEILKWLLNETRIIHLCLNCAKAACILSHCPLTPNHLLEMTIF